ncbi:MAG: Glyoxalase/bleomycin resistance protein/dioxygenase [Cyanobacteria bacterium RYN_339]|nr:Glyoxalase/bleomycin resistance protein/dioxygenase [Cyanobacteria bacterium RYN_339]
MTETAAQNAKATTAYTPGAFVWHECYTKDIASSKKFYEELFGWRIEKSPMPDMDYYLVYVGDKQVAGMFQPEHVMNYWQGYVSVTDVDAAAKAAGANGAKVMMEPTDIPHIGRFSAIQDPQGAVFSLYKSANGDPDGEAMPAPGEPCWDSLNTSDVSAAAAFYQKVVGWTFEANEGGGVFKAGDLMEASVDEAQGGTPPSWLMHVFVKDLAEARAKAEKLGAKTLMAEIDTGEWGKFGVIQDPNGAVLSLFQPKEG